MQGFRRKIDMDDKVQARRIHLLTRLYVRPDCYGEGIGTRLLGETEGIVIRNAAGDVFGYSNRHLATRAFYERGGYLAIGNEEGGYFPPTSKEAESRIERLSNPNKKGKTMITEHMKIFKDLSKCSGEVGGNQDIEPVVFWPEDIEEFRTIAGEVSEMIRENYRTGRMTEIYTPEQIKAVIGYSSPEFLLSEFSIRRGGARFVIVGKKKEEIVGVSMLSNYSLNNRSELFSIVRD
jgi:hypothetical protein